MHQELREVKGKRLGWVGSGSSLAKTAFSFAVGAALRFWPVCCSCWLNVGCHQASLQGGYCRLLFLKEKVFEGARFSLFPIPFEREKSSEIAASSIPLKLSSDMYTEDEWIFFFFQ